MYKAKVSDYYFPIFIFLVIITGYWDSPLRKVISLILPVFIVSIFFINFRFSLKSNVVTNLLYLYVCLCVITSFFAYDVMTSIFFTSRIFVFFLLISALYHWMYNRKRYLLILKYIMISGTVLSISIFYSRFFGDVIVELEGAVRAGGIYSNVNSAGFVLFASIIFTFLLYLEEKRKKYLGFILFFLVALVFTGSRASLLALTVTILMYNIRFKITKKILSIALLGGVTLLTIILLLHEKIILTLRLDRGFSARQILYDIGWEVSKNHPVFGIGLGNLKEVGLSYLEAYPVGEWRKSIFREIGIQSSHNAFIETAAEIGFMGALSLVLIVLVIGFKYYKALRKTEESNKNHQFLIWAFFVGVLTRCFFESNGIINRGWITIDIFFWVMYVIFLRQGHYRSNKI